MAKAIRTADTIQIWHDSGSRWCSFGVPSDPTFDAVCDNIDNDTARELGIDLDGVDSLGVYHPEFAPESSDIGHLMSGNIGADLLALRFQAMGG